MNGYLLDTNVLSEMTRPQPDLRVLQWLIGQEKQALNISVITLGEMRRGARLLAEGRRRMQLDIWIQRDLRALLGGGVLPVTEQIADSWGSLSAARQRQGRPLPIADGLIAATALLHELTLVTRNISDFDNLDLAIVNPWESQPAPLR